MNGRRGGATSFAPGEVRFLRPRRNLPLVFARLAMIGIAVAGLVVLGSIGVAAGCYARRVLAPAWAADAYTLGLVAWVGSMGLFALALAADLLVARR